MLFKNRAALKELYPRLLSHSTLCAEEKGSRHGHAWAKCLFGSRLPIRALRCANIPCHPWDELSARRARPGCRSDFAMTGLFWQAAHVELTSQVDNEGECDVCGRRCKGTYSAFNKEKFADYQVVGRWPHPLTVRYIHEFCLILPPDTPSLAVPLSCWRRPSVRPRRTSFRLACHARRTI